jgi:hypothetical protein
MKAALVVTWNDAKPGRELKALDFAAEVTGFWEKQAAAGKCSRPETFLSPGTGRGTWLVKGERSVLEQLQESPESITFLAKGEVLLEHFRWEIQLAGESVQEFFVEYAKALELVTS